MEETVDDEGETKRIETINIAINGDFKGVDSEVRRGCCTQYLIVSTVVGACFSSKPMKRIRVKQVQVAIYSYVPA